MRHLFSILITFFFVISCQKKDIKLPTLQEKGIVEIHNHSQVWFFYNKDGDEITATVNRKNTISTI